MRQRHSALSFAGARSGPAGVCRRGGGADRSQQVFRTAHL